MTRFDEAWYAAEVVAALQREGWTTYEEVPLDKHRADIVATRGPVIAVIECKRSISLDVLAQCQHWIRAAHQVYAAAPVVPRAKIDVLHSIVSTLRIGIIADKRVILTAPFNRKAPERAALRAALIPERASGSELVQAGSPSKYWTAFGATRKCLIDIVTQQPGITMQHAVSRMKAHHYGSDRSAVAALLQHCRTGVIGGITTVRQGRQLLLYPAERAS
jgi:hypothetical protein